MKIHQSLFVAILLLLCSTALHAQKTKTAVKVDSLVISDINRLGVYYQSNKFHLGYELLQKTYTDHFDQLPDNYKAILLELGIKLTFALDNRDETLEYLNRYLEFAPTFSENDLTGITPQLELYIEDFVLSKTAKSVMVNKHSQNIDFVPASVIVYTRQEIEELGVRNLMDLLKITPGFSEIGDNNERVLGTRGSSNTTTQDVLFLINGHRLNDLLTGSANPDWVNLNYIEQVEMVLGPGSSLYGGNAFSGVVNIITKSGLAGNKSNISLNAGNGTSGSNLNNKYNSYALNYDWSKRISNIEGIYFSASLYNSGGSQIDYSKSNKQLLLPDTLKNGQILQPINAGGKEYINQYAPSYDLLFSYNRKSLQITANAQSSTFIFSRPNSQNLWANLSYDSMSLMRRRIDKKEFIKVEYDFFSNNKNLKQHSLVLKVAGDHFLKDFTTPAYSTGNLKNSRLVGNEYRSTVNLDFATNSVNKRNYLLVGVEGMTYSWLYNYYQDDSVTHNMIIKKVGDYFSSNPTDRRLEYSFAAYLQSENHLIKDKLVLTTGVRFNYHNVYNRWTNFQYGLEYSPRFALVFAPPQPKSRFLTYKLKLIYNSAFLPPPFLMRKGGVESFPANFNLISQTIQSGELVIFGNIGKQTPNSSLTYSINTYLNELANRITRVNGQYINIPADIRTEGYEASLKYDFTPKESGMKLSSFLNYSNVAQNYQNSQNQPGNYLTVFRGGNYWKSDSLLFYPKHYLKAGLHGTYSTNKKSEIVTEADKNYGKGMVYKKGLDKIVAGITAQYTAGSKYNSSYHFNSQGNLEYTPTSSTLQTIDPALVMNCFINFYYNNFKIGASVYNLQNKDYLLSAPVSNLQTIHAEGRMIYLNLAYNINN